MIQMQLVKADGKAEYALLEQLAARSGEVDRQVTAAVTEIIDTVRREGDAAVREYTRRFDGWTPRCGAFPGRNWPKWPPDARKPYTPRFKERRTISGISISDRCSRAG